MRRPTSRLILLIALAFLATGCKSTDDYLADLATLDPAPISGQEFLQEKAIVFDAGQLAHEAFAGLSTAESMKFWQAMLSLSHACKFLGTARGKPLLQGDAAIHIGVIVSRMPIPPVSTHLTDLESQEERVYEAVKALVAGRDKLRLRNWIEALDSPDEVQKIEAYERLKTDSGEDFGTDVDAWTAWYQENESQFVSEFVEKSSEPLQFLGSLRWNRGPSARQILRIFALWVQQYGRPELEDVYVPAIMSVARQTAVLSLKEAMIKTRDPIVRADVAEAMGMILDPDFGEALVSQLPLERDSYAAAKMLQALAAYPSRKTIENAITSMAKSDPVVSENAAQILLKMTGVNHKRDLTAWEEWWLEEGEKLWP